MQNSEKTELREAMQRQRRLLSASARRTQDQQLFEQLKDLPSVRYSKRLLMTLSFNGECDTWSFARWAITHKGSIVLPRVDREKRILSLHWVDNLESQVEAGFHGVHEPLPSCATADISEIEWVLVPGLAFDAQGGRLGYGGGYFDRLLAQLPKLTYRIGLSYRFQLLSEVPTEPHDEWLDTIVLPMGPLQTRHLLTGI
ncbi:MAG: 5-formyltetrahydrofolate cyclo-ligase [Pseudomonadota bacterium]